MGHIYDIWHKDCQIVNLTLITVIVTHSKVTFSGLHNVAVAIVEAVVIHVFFIYKYIHDPGLLGVLIMT